MVLAIYNGIIGHTSLYDYFVIKPGSEGETAWFLSYSESVGTDIAARGKCSRNTLLLLLQP